MSLIDAKNFNDVITFAKQIKKHLIITEGIKVQYRFSKMKLLRLMHKIEY